MIPVVYGPRSYAGLVPRPEAVIEARNFPTAARLADYLQRVGADPNLFAHHTGWRGKPSTWDPLFLERFGGGFGDEKFGQWQTDDRSVPTHLCALCHAAVERPRVASLPVDTSCETGQGALFGER